MKTQGIHRIAVIHEGLKNLLTSVASDVYVSVASLAPFDRTFPTAPVVKNKQAKGSGRARASPGYMCL